MKKLEERSLDLIKQYSGRGEFVSQKSVVQTLLYKFPDDYKERGIIGLGRAVDQIISEKINIERISMITEVKEGAPLNSDIGYRFKK